MNSGFGFGFNAKGLAKITFERLRLTRPWGENLHHRVPTDPNTLPYCVDDSISRGG